LLTFLHRLLPLLHILQIQFCQPIMELCSLLSKFLDQELQKRDGCSRIDGFEMDENVVTRERFEGVWVGCEDLREFAGQKRGSFSWKEEGETCERRKRKKRDQTHLHRPIKVLLEHPTRRLKDQRQVLGSESEEVADRGIELVFRISVVFAESGEKRPKEGKKAKRNQSRP